MTVSICYKGTDLDLIYETPKLGVAHANVNYQSQVGSPTGDIAGRYTDLAAVTTGNGNIATRIPATGILLANGTDLSSIFAGSPGQYSLTTLTTQTGAVVRSVGTTATLTHQFTVTFASAAALTNYFNFGGRIQIQAANNGTFTAGTADALLQTMLSSMGTLIIYDSGHYRTGAGGTVNNPTVGGSNLGTTSTTFFTLTDGSPYGTSTYVVTAVANAAAASATVLTITAVLTLVQAGSVADSYAGSRVSTIQQRNYSGAVTPTQSAPTYSTITFNW